VAETVIIQDARGQAPAKRQRRAVQLHQRRLQQLCFDVRDGRKSRPTCAGGAERIRTLRSIALNHCYERYLA